MQLSNSYTNSYDRLIKLLLENGSGYLQIDDESVDFSEMVKPTTPTEELGRFTFWETKLRNRSEKAQMNVYPKELVGEWLVEDEVAGESIGVTKVIFEEGGGVKIEDREGGGINGLRWRLDAGPAHMDTATFQVKGADGLVLMYKGFLDRGARLESRISGRGISIKGTVTWQLMSGANGRSYPSDYTEDIRPLVAQETKETRFVMKRQTKRRNPDET